MTLTLTTTKLTIARWRETVIFPDWKGIRLRAKLDTGARSSAIHAEEYEVIRHPSTAQRPVNEELRMKIKVGTKHFWVTAPILEYRNVKNSGGKIEERPFIETTLEMMGRHLPVVMSVTNRDKMRFPVLLGRTFLSGRFLVDPRDSVKDDE